MLAGFLLLIGFTMLIKGADVFVNASIGIAKKLNVSPAIIALTIVAMGTSAPEGVISITASAQGVSALAIGNVVGSNLFNLMFVIGLCAMIRAMPFKAKEISKDFWMSIIATAMLLALMLIGRTYIPRWGGGLLLLCFLIYIVTLIRKAKKDQEANEAPPEEADKPRPFPLIITFALLGFALIIFGGQLTVDSATKIAVSLGVTERIIGMTIVAVGTSLPEMVTSLVACKKGENEFAIGNIVGSNIFNIMLVLGIAGLITPLEIDSAYIYDATFLLIGSTAALIFFYTNKRLARREGLIIVLIYLIYMYLVVR
ncbi:MAG: calcium/sodium antiporter [Lachnospiraceae bacterium]|jgi:cation:H+ antiporter|nr:calcium/sodium antiporter [Lachnospiraceae bacterium]